ncbi:MAG: L,D-transpeptidase family protein [Clostridia bacterium]
MGLNVPWGKFGIHGTLNPYSLGWASSHGCIRMNNDDVAELYSTVPVGTKVVIVNGPYGDFGTGFRDLKSGMYGSDVMQIQKRLKELGFFSGTPNRKIWLRNRKSSTKILPSKWAICKKNNRCGTAKTYGVLFNGVNFSKNFLLIFLAKDKTYVIINNVRSDFDEK